MVAKICEARNLGVEGFGAAGHRSMGGLPKQAVKCLALSLVECAEHLVLDRR
jgi:hypothetical protein